MGGSRSDLREQVRFTMRKLRRSPGYSASAVGLLGLGLGVVAATYTVLDQVVLRPLPVHDQDGLVVAWANHTVRGFDHYPVTAELFEAAQQGGAPALSGVAAVGSYGTSQVVVERGGGPTPVAWARVLGDFFGVLGVEPSLGRALRASDDVPDPDERVAVISHGLWQRFYGAADDAVGDVLRTRMGTFTVVGVMPPDFDYPRGADVWAPTRPEYSQWASERPLLELDLVARLTTGATMEAVREQLSALARSTSGLTATYEGAVPVVRTFEEHVLGDLKPTLLVLFAAGVLVLLVATMDLANLVVVRAIGEQPQVAVRQALGMDPRWTFAEFIIEAAAIALSATGLGILLGTVGVRTLLPFAPDDLARLGLVRDLDLPAYLIVAIGALVAVAAAVVIPRWRIGRRRWAQPLRGAFASASDRAGTLLREGAVVGQVAIAVWVLVVGALLIRTVANLQALDAGFDPDDLAVVALDHADGGVFVEPAENRRLAAAVARLERYRGVSGATPVQMAPLPGNGAWQTILNKEAQSAELASEENAFLFMDFVEPDFVSVLDVPVLRGRVFGESDDAAASLVLVVNEAAARLYWPARDAVGQRVTVGFPGFADRPFTVIGVVGDTRYGDLTDLKPTVFFPVRQLDIFGARYLLVRTTGSGVPLLQLAREALRAEAPHYRATSVGSVRERLDEPLLRPRFAALLLSVLASTALLMAVTGVYSVMAFLVRTRRRELGVRMACGATRVNVGGLVVRRGLVVATIGSGFGAVAAVSSAGLFQSLLFGVPLADLPSLFMGVGIALVSTTLACLAPALRAATTHPATVLRSE